MYTGRAIILQIAYKYKLTRNNDNNPHKGEGEALELRWIVVLSQKRKLPVLCFPGRSYVKNGGMFA
jgi:hypothetical protein